MNGIFRVIYVILRSMILVECDNKTNDAYDKLIIDES